MYTYCDPSKSTHLRSVHNKLGSTWIRILFSSNVVLFSHVMCNVTPRNNVSCGHRRDSRSIRFRYCRRTKSGFQQIGSTSEHTDDSCFSYNFFLRFQHCHDDDLRRLPLITLKCRPNSSRNTVNCIVVTARGLREPFRNVACGFSSFYHEQRQMIEKWKTQLRLIHRGHNISSEIVCNRSRVYRNDLIDVKFKKNVFNNKMLKTTWRIVIVTAIIGQSVIKYICRYIFVDPVWFSHVSYK